MRMTSAMYILLPNYTWLDLEDIASCTHRNVLAKRGICTVCVTVIGCLPCVRLQRNMRIA